MSEYRPLNQEEIIAVTTLNCSASASAEKIDKLGKRLSEEDLRALTEANKTIKEMVTKIVNQGPDLDEKRRIVNRMNALKISVGYTNKPFEQMIFLTMDDANTLIWPALERCNLDCPFAELERELGNEMIYDKTGAKQCETRKALIRAGVKGTGLSEFCPYYMTDAIGW